MMVNLLNSKQQEILKQIKTNIDSFENTGTAFFLDDIHYLVDELRDELDLRRTYPEYEFEDESVS